MDINALMIVNLNSKNNTNLNNSILQLNKNNNINPYLNNNSK